MKTTDAKFKERVREKVLAKLAEGYSTKAAARAAGIHRRTLDRMRRADEEFNEECLDAIEAGTDELEDHALKRSKKSDVVLMFLLNGRRPQKFRRKPIDGEDVGDTIVNFTLNLGTNVPLHPTNALPETERRNLLPAQPANGRASTLQFDRSEHEDGEDRRVHGMDT